MKILTRYTHLIAVTVPVSILILGLFLFFPEQLTKVFYLHWLILGIALLLALSPLGKIRLTAIIQEDELVQNKISLPPQYTGLTGFVMIVLLQIVLQILFIEMLHFTHNIMPIFTINPTPSNLAGSMVYLGLMEGLFPWGLMALQAVNLSLNAFVLKQDAYFHTCFYQLLPRSANQPLAASCNTLTRGLNMIAISSNLLLLCIWLIYLSQSWWLPLTHDFNLGTFMIILGMLLIVMLKKLRNRISQLFFAHKRLNLGVLLTAIIFSIILFILNSIFHIWQPIPIKPPRFLAELHTHGTRVVYLLFMNGWWLAWIPLISVFIGHFLKGYRIRLAIFTILAWPFLSLLLFLLWPHPFLFLLQLPASINFLIALTAMTLLILIMTTKNRSPLLMLGYLSKIQNPKPRSTTQYLQLLLVFMGFLLYLYLPAGLMGLTPYYLIPGLPIALGICIGIISCWQMVLKIKKL